jgi:biopolymer transport protein ExbD
MSPKKFSKIFDENELNLDLTPLIDVIFILLIFFILTTTFAKPVLDVMLPKSKMATMNANSNYLNISISKEGKFFYNNEEVNLKKIEEMIKNDKSKLNIIADKDANFGAFVQLLDLAKEYRNGEFVITTEKDNHIE